MQRHRPYGIAAIALVLTSLLIGPPPAALSQGREQNKTPSEAGRKVPAFKGSGVVRRLPKGPLTPPPALALSAGVMAQLIGRQPGSLYARLSPSEPIATNRGALVFANAAVVEGGEGYARWSTPSFYKADVEAAAQNDYLALWLKSSVASRYLIDCVVSTNYTHPFKVIGPNSSASQISELAEAKGHLIFTLDATSAGWYGFQISGSGYSWTFYSCEVTNL